MACDADFDRSARSSYITVMKYFAASAALVATLVLPVGAMACDRHGGYYNPMSGADWRTYTPQASYMDPALMESEWEDRETVPAARPERPKPKFSFVASRASERALAARAKTAKSDVSDDTSTVQSSLASDKTAPRKVRLKTDR